MLALMYMYICDNKNISRQMLSQNQNQPQLGINLFNINKSDKCSDMLSFYPSLSHFNMEYQQKKQNNSKMQEEILLDQQITSEQGQQYFNILFSSHLMASCLARRNTQLEIRYLQNQYSQPEEIYLKRVHRMNNLQSKQKKNYQILSEMKINWYDKYKALFKLMKFLGQIKQKLNGLRHDYFSEKTFLSLNKISSQQIIHLTKILQQILQSVFLLPQKYLHYQKNKIIDQRYVEFLIIPRFFVSKCKITRFIRDEVLQKNFQFLIYHGCLGHYNNQANKKYPEQYQMGYIRSLLQYPDGRQKFKKICSINHGCKFYNKFGTLYFELYEASLQSLKRIDIICKKSCTSQQIRQQIIKDDKRIESSQNEIFMNQNSHQMFNQIKSITSFLNLDIFQEKQQKLTKTQSLVKLQFNPRGSVDSPTLKQKSKNRLRRPYSLIFENKYEQQEQTKFKVKRWYTMDTYQTMRSVKQRNIIIVHPPNQNLFIH